MARPKGSKNIPKDQEVVDTDQISEDKNLVKDPIKEPIQVKDPEPKKKILIGYHPITGAEVWQ
jgi:hypothetical protein